MQRKRLLVVEDEPLIRMLLEDCLTNAGFEVVEACNGEAAVQALERLDRIDLVLTDIQMPGPIDGNHVGTKAKQQHPSVPVIYASGRADSLKNRVEKPDVFVQKPYGISVIVAIVTRLLSSS